jgi:hypothetical protein
MSAIVTAADFPEIRWRGHWIWAEPPPAGRSPFGSGTDAGPRPEARAFFRKTFALAQVPARVPARITADSRYLLFVNGQEAYRGPIRGQPRRLTYDMLDLAPYLKPGENTVAILVVYYGKPRSFWMPAAANASLGRNGVVVFEAKTFEVSDDGWLVSDASWKALKATPGRKIGRTSPRCTRSSATPSRPRWWTPAACPSAGNSPASMIAAGAART